MYLSKISIKGYKGIRDLEVEFNPNINIIIGENGSCKSALIDSIRLLYNLGNQQKDIFVSEDDFYYDKDSKKTLTKIEISYQFRDLSEAQKGAYYEFMVLAEDPKHDYINIGLSYEYRENRYPDFSYYTGAVDGQKAEFKTFELFQHYYLGALRDSTKDLLRIKGNILGGLIKRSIDRNGTSKNFEQIISTANNELLKQKEVLDARENINQNLKKIYKQYIENQVGLLIEPSKLDYIVNVIKPYLPFSLKELAGDGLQLCQNSLGFNNLIYIATILGDIDQRIKDEPLTHYALLIEEPEAHLHPQLQLSLYSFLKETNKCDNSQLFITTHSPTLTSKVPFENLILLDKKSYRMSNCFAGREDEKIIEDTKKQKELKEQDFKIKEKMLERYIDVTRSQLFYAKKILLVEGISEELLIPVFCKLDNFKLEDYRIELVNVQGTSFYPFLYLFNSKDEKKVIPKKVAVLTDDDRFTESKKPEYSFKNLIEDNYSKLDELYNQLIAKHESSREEERYKLAILLWKAMPSKAVFAQDFSFYICENFQEAKKTLIIPPYILEAFQHLK
ncbi:AAA family ATPase [Candidatus Desantisbacteria bacterium]|nr:AAA family ATPase [Candidatus Desantisbacteria bacterium]